MRTHEEGFGLVEIMVGLAIGMLAMIVVMQVYSQSEAQKRSTTSGADAQTNGAIALSIIERDVRNGGWGMAISQYAGCDTMYTYCDGSAECGGTAGEIPAFSLAPIIITDGGNGPDTITAQYYADPNIGPFRLPTNTVISDNMPSTSAELDVNSTEGCNVGDLMLAQQDNKCTLMQVTALQGQPVKIQHNPGASGIYNPPASFSNANNWPQYTVGAKLTCFSAAPNGPQFKRSYSVDGTLRQLLRSDNASDSSANREVISPEIVDMQVEYGISANAGSQSLSSWVKATAGTTWANPSRANANRIKAVRIALLARSAQPEKPDASGVCNTTTNAMVSNWPAWAGFNTARLGSEWRCYRYKAFETVVPLRNVLWGNV